MQEFLVDLEFVDLAPRFQNLFLEFLIFKNQSFQLFLIHPHELLRLQAY